MLKRCFCGRCQLETEHADMVLNGTPMCDVDCLKRAREFLKIQREFFKGMDMHRARVGGQNIGRRL